MLHMSLLRNPVRDTAKRDNNAKTLREDQNLIKGNAAHFPAGSATEVKTGHIIVLGIWYRL